MEPNSNEGMRKWKRVTEREREQEEVGGRTTLVCHLRFAYTAVIQRDRANIVVVLVHE